MRWIASRLRVHLESSYQYKIRSVGDMAKKGEKIELTLSSILPNSAVLINFKYVSLLCEPMAQSLSMMFRCPASLH